MGNAYDYSIILSEGLIDQSYREFLRKVEDLAVEIYRLLVQFDKMVDRVNPWDLSSLAKDIYRLARAVLDYPIVICRRRDGILEIRKPLSREGLEDLLSSHLYTACWVGVQVK